MQLFTDAFSRDHQLIWCDPRHATYLATALVLRGQGAAIGDMQRNVGRIRSSIKMAHWNTEVRAQSTVWPSTSKLLIMTGPWLAFCSPRT